jgi:hypothetical protein
MLSDRTEIDSLQLQTQVFGGCWVRESARSGSSSSTFFAPECAPAVIDHADPDFLPPRRRRLELVKDYCLRLTEHKVSAGISEKEEVVDHSIGKQARQLWQAGGQRRSV